MSYNAFIQLSNGIGKPPQTCGGTRATGLLMNDETTFGRSDSRSLRTLLLFDLREFKLQIHAPVILNRRMFLLDCSLLQQSKQLAPGP